MAKKKIRATAELFLDTKSAKSDAAKFTSDLMRKLNDIETAADKLTVFKDLVDYIGQADKALGALKSKNADAFSHMFDGLDTALREQMEGLFGTSKDSLKHIDILRDKIGTLGTKSSIKEVRGIAKEINELFTSAGADAPFGDLNLEFANKVKPEYIDKISNALDNFATVWQDVTQKVSGGFGFGGSGGDGGFGGFSAEVQAEIDKLEAQITQLKSKKTELNKILTNKHLFDTADDLDLDVEATEDNVKRLIQQYQMLDDASKKIAKGTAQYNSNLAERAKIGLQISAIRDSDIEFDPKISKSIRDIIDSDGFTSILNEFEKTIGNISKNIDDEIAGIQAKILDVKKNGISDQYSGISGTGGEISQYDKLNKKLKEYFGLLEQRKNVKSDSLEYEQLTSEIDQVAEAIEKIKSIGDDDAFALRDILGDIEYEEITSVEDALERICNLLKIDIPSATGGTGSGPLGKMVSEAEYIQGLILQIERLFGNINTMSGTIEYKVLINGQEVDIMQGGHKEVSQQAAVESYLGTLGKKRYAAAHNHPGGASSRYNEYDFKTAMNEIYNGVSAISMIVGEKDVTTLDLARVKMEDAMSVLQQIKKLKVDSVSSEKINEMFKAINPEYGDVAKTWQPAQLQDLAKYVYEVGESANLSIDPLEQFQNLLKSVTDGKIDLSKYQDVFDSFKIENASSIFNHIMASEGEELRVDNVNTSSLTEFIDVVKHQQAELVKLRNEADITYSDIHSMVKSYMNEISSDGDLENGASSKFIKQYFGRDEQGLISTWLMELENGESSILQVTNRIAGYFQKIDPSEYLTDAKASLQDFLNLTSEIQSNDLYSYNAEGNVEIGKYIERLTEAKTALDTLGEQGLLTAEQLSQVESEFFKSKSTLDAAIVHYDGYGNGYYWDSYENEYNAEREKATTLSEENERLKQELEEERKRQKTHNGSQGDITSEDEIDDIRRENGALEEKLELLLEISQQYGSQITQKKRDRYEELNQKEMNDGLSSREEERMSDLFDEIVEADEALEEFGNTYDKITLKLANGKKVDILPDDDGLRKLYKFFDGTSGDDYSGVEIEDIIFNRKQEQAVIQQSNQELQEQINLQRQINSEKRTQEHDVDGDIARVNQLLEKEKLTYEEILALVREYNNEAKMKSFSDAGDWDTYDKIFKNHADIARKLVPMEMMGMGSDSPDKWLASVGMSAEDAAQKLYELYNRLHGIDDISDEFDKIADTKDLSDKSVSAEVSYLDGLLEKVNEVKAAVDLKTQAFKEEAETVDTIVSQELQALESLRVKIEDVKNLVDEFTVALNGQWTDKIDGLFPKLQQLAQDFTEINEAINSLNANLHVDTATADTETGERQFTVKMDTSDMESSLTSVTETISELTNIISTAVSKLGDFDKDRSLTREDFSTAVKEAIYARDIQPGYKKITSFEDVFEKSYGGLYLGDGDYTPDEYMNKLTGEFFGSIDDATQDFEKYFKDSYISKDYSNVFKDIDELIAHIVDTKNMESSYKQDWATVIVQAINTQGDRIAEAIKIVLPNSVSDKIESGDSVNEQEIVDAFQHVAREVSTWTQMTREEPRDFFRDLLHSRTTGMTITDPKTIQAFKTLGMMSESGKPTFKLASQGLRNSGVVIGEEYVMPTRPKSLDQVDQLGPLLDEASKLGAAVPRIVSSFTDSSKIFELQTRMIGENIASSSGSWDFLKATDAQIDKLIHTFETLSKVGLYPDFIGDNVLFDKNKGFSLVDLETTNISWGRDLDDAEGMTKWFLDYVENIVPKDLSDQFRQRVNERMALPPEMRSTSPHDISKNDTAIYQLLSKIAGTIDAINSNLQSIVSNYNAQQNDANYAKDQYSTQSYEDIKRHNLKYEASNVDNMLEANEVWARDLEADDKKANALQFIRGSVKGTTDPYFTRGRYGEVVNQLTGELQYFNDILQMIENFEQEYSEDLQFVKDYLNKVFSQYDVQTDAVLNQQSGVYGDVQSGDAYVSDNMSGIDAADVQEEINSIEKLLLVLQQVEEAVQNKTQAFVNEGDVVGQVVNEEVLALQRLSELIELIVSNIGLVVDGFNQINTEIVNTEANKDGVEDTVEEPTPTPDTTSIDTSYALDNTVLETNRILESILTKLGDGSSFSDLVEPLNAAVTELKNVAHGIVEHQKAQRTNLTDSSARIANNYGQLSSIAGNATAGLGDEYQIENMKALADNVVRVKGAVKDTEGVWKGFVVDIDESNKAVMRSVDEQSAFAKSLNESAKAAKNAGTEVKEAGPKDEFAQSLSAAKSAFNEYRKGLQGVDYLSDEAKDSLDELAIRMGSISNAGELDAWIDDLRTLQKQVAISKSGFEHSNLGTIKGVQNKLDTGYNKLTLEQQKEIEEDYHRITDILEQYKASVRDGKKVELEAIHAATQALREKIEAQLALNQAAEDSKKTAKKNEKFGSTVAVNATAKFNSLKDQATSGEFANSRNVANALQETEAAYQKLIDTKNKLNNSDSEITKDQEADFKRLRDEYNEKAKALKKLLDDSKKLNGQFDKSMLLGDDFQDTDEGRKAVLADFVKEVYGVTVAAEDFRDGWQKVVFTVDNGDGTFTEMTATLNAARTQVGALAGDVKKNVGVFESFFNELKGKFKSISAYLISSLSIHEVWQQVRKGVEYVKEIDGALTELKKVTDETDASYDRFLQDMSKTGSVIGATVANLTTMAADWARLGYSMEEAGKLAESTAILLNVSEFEDATKASEALISTMQAFGYAANESQHVVDVLNEVGELLPNNIVICYKKVAISVNSWRQPRPSKDLTNLIFVI